MPTIVLASASPARAATLRAAGLEPLIIPSGVDEEQIINRYDVAHPADVALRLAQAKCESVAAQSDLPGDAIVVGCDSLLDLEGRSLGKPSDAADAFRRWQRMRGRTGMLHTGHWVVDRRLDGQGATFGTVASTTVEFANVSDAEIEAYVATGEPLHVAGAFCIDGMGGAFVRSIEGDYHNVVGISLPLMRELLAEIDVAWPDLWVNGKVSSAAS